MSQTRYVRKFVSLGPDGWIEGRGRLYRYLIHLSGNEGNYTATAAEVLGASAAGGSVEEVMASVRATLLAMLKHSEATGEPMPRGEVPPSPASVVRCVNFDLDTD